MKMFSLKRSTKRFMETKILKILAIDDNPDNLISLNALIREAFPDATVFTATSGKRGLELSIQEDPDVILLDIVMPEMDGFEVCRKLKADQRLSDIPVVFVTALKGDKESRIKALECGGEAFLAKPVDESELTAQIRAMVKIKTANTDKRNENERLKQLVEERTKELEAELSERKRAEKALKQSEERFQLLFNQAPLGYQSLDFDGCFLEVNQQWLDTLGFSRKEVIGKWFGDFISPEYKEGFRQRFPLFKAQGQIHSEFEMVHKNGSKIFIAFEGKIGYNLDGGFKQTHCILQDITLKKLAEEALKESEEKYSILFENSPDSYLIISDGIFVDCNKATEIMMRGDRSQIIGQTPDAISPEFQPDGRKSSDAAAENVAWAFANGKNTFEWMHRRFDGSDLYVEVSIASMMLKGKLNLFTTWRDISERKLAEKALRESETQFREFFEKAADSIFVADIETGMIVDVNKAATRLMNRTYEQLVGIHQSQLHPPVMEKYAKETFNNHKELVKQNLPSNALENTIIRADGTEVPVEILAAEVTFKGKRCMHGTFRDITERKKAEELLRESEYFFKESQRAAFVGSYKFDIAADHWTSSEVLDQIFGIDKNFSKSLQSWIDIIHPDDREMMAKYFSEEVVGKRQPFNKEYRIISQIDNEIRWVLGLGKLKLDAENHVVEMIGTIQDITERILSQQALNEKTQLFQELFNASPDAILLIDPHHPKLAWPIVDCNIAACRMNGYTREELIGKSIDLLNTHDGTSEERQIYLINLRQQGIIHGDFIHRNKDGKIFPVETSTSLICIGGRELILGIDRDITERKRAEQTIKESEERYRRFISQISEGVYRFECDEPMDLSLSREEQIDFIYDHMFIAEYNHSFRKMYGINDQEDITGKSQLDFHGGRNNPINRQALRDFITNGYRIENVITQEKNKHGQMTFFSNNSVGIFENNKLIRMWGTQTDVTEKIRADQIQQVIFSISNATLSSISMPELIELISKEIGKLLDSTNFFIAFYDEKTDMLSTIYERDEKDVIETWPAKNSITGYVIKQQKSFLLREDDVDQLYRDYGIQQFGTPAKVWLGVPLVENKKTIGAIVVQSYDNPDAYTEKDKQVLEFISHQISISIERKRTEKDLRLMGKAFDQSPVTIVITDKEGNIEYVNPKFTESTGYTLDEVKGYNPRILQSGNQSQEFYQELWKTILAGNDWFGEFQNRRKNGDFYWESAVITPITDENGQIAFFLAIKEDITEKKKMIDDLIHARNKAEESDRLKSSFLANMSHEIRTPLNSIIGFSELLLDDDFGQEQHEEFARTINSSGNSLLTIISDIMDFSKIEAGQIQLYKKRFSVNKLISELQKEYNYIASEKGIELRLDPTNPVDEIFIQSDEQRIRQILINFFSNAIKFTEKGFIEIGFGLESDRDQASLVSTIRFSVKDTGIGIPEEYHQQIFERFRQVESSHSRKYGGNGLGLAISKNLVELLGGEIGMVSEKGKGSVFYFTIPNV
jgi:PAS domain S-box-containing protein